MSKPRRDTKDEEPDTGQDEAGTVEMAHGICSCDEISQVNEQYGSIEHLS